MKFAVLIVGVVLCLLAATSVAPHLGPVDTFQLGIAVAFVSFAIPPRPVAP